VFLCAEPDVVHAAGTPCSITPVLTEADLNTCIAEAPTDNSEFAITIGADFNITTQKNIVAGNSITVSSDAITRTLTRDTGFTGAFFSVPVASALTISNIVLDGNKLNVVANNSIVINSGSLTLGSGTVLQNNARNIYAGWGGGIQSSGTLKIIGSTISGNMANQGAGMYVTDGTVEIINSVISGNAASPNGGGGITMRNEPTKLTVSGTIIEGNTGNYGGGIWSVGTVEIVDSTVKGNIAAASGGGMIIGYAASKLTVTNTNIVGNVATTNGGGMVVDGAATISGSTISGNMASWGGGIYASQTPGMTAVAVSDTKISSNTAIDGGGIWIDHASLSNLTVDAGVMFSGNSASTFSRMRPADQALYDAQIFATSFSLPLPFNGYNNYDIRYESDLLTDICQRNSSLWADDTKCVAAPNTGLFGGQANNLAVSALSLLASSAIIAAIFIAPKLIAKRR